VLESAKNLKETIELKTDTSPYKTSPSKSSPNKELDSSKNIAVEYFNSMKLKESVVLN